jgi:hypothetical protein
MSTTPVIPGTMAGDARPRSSTLLAGPKFPILFAAGLPAAVIALSAEGYAQRVSALISLGWFSLVPMALYERWVARALPVVAAAFLVASLAALPFGSAALTVDVWTSAAMFVLSLPRSRGPARQ